MWHEQVKDTLEFYAVWVPLGDSYKQARCAAEQALAGRKNLRDFRPWAHDRAGAPKSSLDGARVSVLGDDRGKPEFRRLRIANGEQLDAIGLIKRAGFEPEQFVPIVNVAAGAWLQQAAKEAPKKLEQVRQACRRAGIHRVERPELPVVAPFCFDASVLYPSRWAATFKELDTPRSQSEAAAWGEAHVRPLLKAVKSDPPAYVACLVADGDRMGAALDRLLTAEKNRQLSKALAEFPAAARKVVEEQCYGSLIYAGGDDVLAFLPVATAADCAAKLAEQFRHIMAAALASAGPPTLSVGIGIGHFMEQMSELLALARRAERLAKDQAGRDALAIIFDKRSGGERTLHLKWSSDPVARLRTDAARLEDSLSSGKVYELGALLRRFGNVPEAQVGRALAVYAAGVLEHAGDGKSATLGDLGLCDPPDGGFPAALQAAINRLLVVRSLREAGFQ